MVGQRAAWQPKATRHNEFTLLMSLVLDDEATEAEAKLLRQHLATCDMCAHIWQRWQELDRRFTQAPLLAAPVDFAAAVMGRLDGRVAERRRRRVMFGLAVSWLGAALVAVLVFSLVGGLTFELLSNNSVLSAAWTGVSSIGGWVIRSLAEVVERLGAPTVAALIGALLCVTCGLATIWLWMVGRLTPRLDTQMARIG